LLISIYLVNLSQEKPRRGQLPGFSYYRSWEVIAFWRKEAPSEVKCTKIECYLIYQKISKSFDIAN